MAEVACCPISICIHKFSNGASTVMCTQQQLFSYAQSSRVLLSLSTFPICKLYRNSIVTLHARDAMYRCYFPNPVCALGIMSERCPILANPRLLQSSSHRLPWTCRSTCELIPPPCPSTFVSRRVPSHSWLQPRGAGRPPDIVLPVLARCLQIPQQQGSAVSV